MAVVLLIGIIGALSISVSFVKYYEPNTPLDYADHVRSGKLELPITYSYVSLISLY